MDTDAAMRFTTNTGDGPHPLDAAPTAVDGEDAGIPGGLTDAARAAEEARVADAPVVGPVDGMPSTPNSGGAHTHSPAGLEHDVDPATLAPFTPPRHNALAQENMEGEGPERLIPGGVTNAHPDFSVDADGNAGPPATGPTTTAHVSTTGRTDFEDGWDRMGIEGTNPAGIPPEPELPAGT